MPRPDTATGYRIYGTRDVLNEERQVLSDPTRNRTASDREARKVLIGLEIEAAVRAKCPMHLIREADVIASMEAELEAE